MRTMSLRSVSLHLHSNRAMVQSQLVSITIVFSMGEYTYDWAMSSLRIIIFTKYAYDIEMMAHPQGRTIIILRLQVIDN